jgi:hypothetical protein
VPRDDSPGLDRYQGCHIKNKKENNMRKKIKKLCEALHDGEIRTGIYVKTIGYKYVTLIDTWGNTTQEKISLENFYEKYWK